MLRVAWNARAGHLDFFALLAARLKQKGLEFSSYFACQHSGEGERLQTTYGVQEPWVLSNYLRDHQSRMDISDDTIRDLKADDDSPSLIQCAWSELFEKGYSEAVLRRHLVGHFAFWEAFFDSHRPDIFVSETPSILSMCVAWLVCKRRGVKFLTFQEIPALGNRVVVSSSWEGHYDELEEALDKRAGMPESEERANTYIDRVIGTGLKTARTTTYVANTGGLLFGIPRSLRGIDKLLHRVGQERAYYVNATLGERATRRVQSAIRRFLCRTLRLFDRHIEPATDRYFLFPLHMLGEWSHYQHFGMQYGDQVGAVYEVASCLPFGTSLYVKEHRSGFGRRKLKDYREIRRFRQTRLIDPYHDTTTLIKHAQAVVTLGGTMGFEAFVMGKPVILLSRASYQSFPGIHHADTPERLARMLENVDRLPSADRNEVQRCVSALFDISFEAYMYPIEDLIAPENIDRFADAMCQRLEVYR